MSGLRMFLSRVVGLFRRRDRDEQLRDEIDAHRRALVDEHLARGLSPEEAERAARQSLGPTAPMAEAFYDQRGLPALATIGQDVRFATRIFTRRPGFTALAVIALGLGIGVSTGFFTLVNAICLRGLPIDRPEDVLFLSTRTQQGLAGGLSRVEFEEARRDATSFEGLAAYAGGRMVLGDDDRAPERVNGTYISANAFHLLRQQSAFGREFRPDEDRPDAPRVAMLGARVWAGRYARDPSMLGRVIRVNGQDTTIVGIMPEGFGFPSNTDIWVPLAALGDSSPSPDPSRRLSVFGRLTEGRSSADIHRELDTLTARLARQYPDSSRNVRILAEPINDRFNGNITDTVWVAFMTAGGLVLLIACANVANLLLMHSTSRFREVAIRASLGATRLRVIRQLLVECALLSVAGCGLGLLLSIAGVRLLAASVPGTAPLPYFIQFTVDARVLGVLSAACALCVFVCGLLPAWQTSAVRIPQALRSTAQLGSPARRTRRQLAGFLTIEVALSVVLLANMAMSLRDVAGADPIVDTTALLTATLTLPPEAYASGDARAFFYTQLEARIGGLGGVASATIASPGPFESPPERPLVIEGHSPSVGDRPPSVLVHLVGRDFFDVVGLPVLRGRPFIPADGTASQPGTIVNDRLAELYFPGENPIGRRLQLADSGAQAGEGWLTVIGVSPAVREHTAESPEPIAYIPYWSDPPESVSLIARVTRGHPAALAPAIREVVRALDPNLPVDQLMPLQDALHQSRWNGRVSATIIYVIASIAFALAMVGLYAVTAYRTSQRTAEIGLRMALGAAPWQVAWLVLRGALTQLGLGLAVGAALTLAYDHFFVGDSSSLLDPRTFLPLVVVIALVAAAACLVPALRAARVEPTRALRCE